MFQKGTSSRTYRAQARYEAGSSQDDGKKATTRAGRGREDASKGCGSKHGPTFLKRFLFCVVLWNMLSLSGASGPRRALGFRVYSVGETAELRETSAQRGGRTVTTSLS